MRSYLRAFTRASAGGVAGRGSALNFSAGVLFIGGVGITRNHVRLPRRPRRRLADIFMVARASGCAVSRYSSFSFSLLRRTSKVERVSDVDVIFCEGRPPRGVLRIAYINPSSTCLPHVARQFAVFRGVK